MRTRARESIPGFTLVEILCVVVILGICAAIIIPQISDRDDVRTAAMARTLMADLSYAQGRAVATQHRQFVRFDSTNNRYEVLEQLSPTEVMVAHPVNHSPFRVPMGTGRKDELSSVVLDAVSFDAHPVLMFDELGAPYAYNPTNHTPTALIAGTVRLRSKNYTMTVSVEPYSGELSAN